MEGLRGELLWELEIAERQLTALAQAIPAEKYAWRPNDATRSVSRKFNGIATPWPDWLPDRHQP
ncbi:MAG: hypothetical protein ABSE86_22355 [Bryobacteraceae bacterium]